MASITPETHGASDGHSSSGTFPFNRLPAELQIMVWHYARADIPPVIAAQLCIYEPPTLSFSREDVDAIKDYVRLLSTCYTSRREALRSPPAILLGFDYRLPTRKLTVPRIHMTNPFFAHFCKDVIFEGAVIFSPLFFRKDFPEPRERIEYLCRAMENFFGPGVRRFHLFTPTQVGLPNNAPKFARICLPEAPTFREEDAKHFLNDTFRFRTWQYELREVVREHRDGVISKKKQDTPAAGPIEGAADPIEGAADPIEAEVWDPSLIDDVEDPKFYLDGFSKIMPSHFPDLEYVSFLEEVPGSDSR
ncbi:hypothetical protein QBC39DRAFT_92169 [Podospora conica]|nr:hypothetical protein QBC39DRAFT_92169 [Schizothecium conicum]